MLVATENRILNYAGDEYWIEKGQPVPEGMSLDVLVLLDSALVEVPVLEPELRPEPKALAAARRELDAQTVDQQPANEEEEEKGVDERGTITAE